MSLPIVQMTEAIAKQLASQLEQDLQASSHDPNDFHAVTVLGSPIVWYYCRGTPLFGLGPPETRWSEGKLVVFQKRHPASDAPTVPWLQEELNADD